MPAAHSGDEACELRGRPSRYRSCIAACARLSYAMSVLKCEMTSLPTPSEMSSAPTRYSSSRVSEPLYLGRGTNGLRDLFYAKATRDEGIASLF